MKKLFLLFLILPFIISSNIYNDNNSIENNLSLQLIQIAGESPKVFTDGWIFGAKGILFPGSSYAEDISDKIHWSGTGKFIPEYGAETHPVFEKPGINTVTIECEYNGMVLKKSFEVYAVMPDYYACVGDYVHCHACSHGCPGCPHDVIGVIGNGSSTVKVRGKSAARVGDGGMHIETCCGSNTFTIADGDNEVLIDGKPAAKIGSTTTHCGGIGIITGENIHPKISSDESETKKDKNTNPYGIKAENEKSNPNVYFPGERIPLADLLRLSRPPAEFNADLILKEEGPDYEVSSKEIFSNINNIFGFESGTLTLLEELGNMECLKNITDACGKLGVMFAMVNVIGNIYEGKNTEALGNTFKGAGYWSMNAYGWSALKVASVGILVFDYTINRFMKEMIDIRYNTYKEAYYKYYSDDSQVKRDHKKWFKIIEQLYTDSRNLGQDFNSKLEDELGTYLSRFWNPEVSSFYMPPGGFNAELTPEDKKAIMDTYRKEILSPIINAALVGLVDREKKKIDADINKQITELAKLFNTKFPFLVKVNGQPDKIKKVKVQIGEWLGYTDDKGIWKFDATLYGYMKNKAPRKAVFTFDGNERTIPFEIKEKGVTEIIFNMPQPVTIRLEHLLDKNTEGAKCDLNATAQNYTSDYFGEYLTEGFIGKIAWDWKINGTPLSYFECETSFSSNTQSTVFDKPGEYTVEVSLINLVREHPGYGKAIATARKKITINKDKTIVKKEPKVKEEEKVEEKNKEIDTGVLDFPKGDYWFAICGSRGDCCILTDNNGAIFIPTLAEPRKDRSLVINGNNFTINYTNTYSLIPQTETISGSGRIYKGSGGEIMCDVKLSYKYNYEYGQSKGSKSATLNFTGKFNGYGAFDLELTDGSINENSGSSSFSGTVTKPTRLTLNKKQ